MPDTYGYMRYSHGSSRYDWVFPDRKNKGPDEAPYSFDAYYVQNGAKEAKGANVVYSDRFSMWFEREKLERMVAKHLGKVSWGAYENQPLDKLTAFWNAMHGTRTRYQVVATGRCCNVSNGYPIALLWIKDKKAKS